MKRIMCISPHADDIELGAGGYLAKQVAEYDAEVMNLVVCTGDVFFKHLDRIVSEEERREECAASMAVLGVQHLRFPFRGYDTKLDTVPASEIVQALDTEMASFRPTEVLIPLPSSHPDHQATHRACLAACRPSAYNGSLKLIAAYEYPASGWGDTGSCTVGAGGMFVEIAAYMDRKIEALSQYRTQMREGHIFGLDATSAMARMRGIEAGLEMAELFHVMRMIKR